MTRISLENGSFPTPPEVRIQSKLNAFPQYQEAIAKMQKDKLTQCAFDLNGVNYQMADGAHEFSLLGQREIKPGTFEKWVFIKPKRLTLGDDLLIDVHVPRSQIESQAPIPSSTVNHLIYSRDTTNGRRYTTNTVLNETRTVTDDVLQEFIDILGTEWALQENAA